MLLYFLPRIRNLLIKNKKRWVFAGPKLLVYCEPPRLRYSTWINQKYGISLGSIEKLSFYTIIICGIYYTFNNFIMSNRTKFNFYGKIINGVLPALVGIQVFHRTGSTVNCSHGSGFIVRPDGLILTSAHVISKPKNKKIVIYDSKGERYLGTVENIDEINDLATIRIQKSGLPTVKLDYKSDVKVGDSIISLGVFGDNLHKFVNIGDVARTCLLEHDMPHIVANLKILGGCSGGPVVNQRGQVIGVNKACSKDQVMIVPIDVAKQLLPKSIVESFNSATEKYCKITLNYILKIFSSDLPTSK